MLNLQRPRKPFQWTLSVLADLNSKLKVFGIRLLWIFSLINRKTWHVVILFPVAASYNLVSFSSLLRVSVKWSICFSTVGIINNTSSTWDLWLALKAGLRVWILPTRPLGSCLPPPASPVFSWRVLLFSVMASAVNALSGCDKPG